MLTQPRRLASRAPAVLERARSQSATAATATREFHTQGATGSAIVRPTATGITRSNGANELRYKGFRVAPGAQRRFLFWGNKDDDKEGSGDGNAKEERAKEIVERLFESYGEGDDPRKMSDKKKTRRCKEEMDDEEDKELLEDIQIVLDLWDRTYEERYGGGSDDDDEDDDEDEEEDEEGEGDGEGSSSSDSDSDSSSSSDDDAGKEDDDDDDE